MIVQNFINGEFEPCHSYLDSYEPSQGTVWAKIPDSSEDCVDRAVKAAKKAFLAWKSLSVHQRAEYLASAASLLEERLDQFAIAESRDQVFQKKRQETKFFYDFFKKQNNDIVPYSGAPLSVPQVDPTVR